MRNGWAIATMMTTGLVSACATAPALAPSAPAMAAPAPMAGYDWFFNTDDDQGDLAYGVAESDDLKLGFSCARGAGQLEIMAMADPGARPEILLESGGETERWPAKAEPSHISDDDLLTAMARADTPVFLRFRQEKWIALWRNGAREAYAAHPESTDQVDRFFAFCG